MEQMAYEAAKLDPLNPGKGNTIRKITGSIGDDRWKGWEKWEIVIRSKEGTKVTVHFVYESALDLFDDFKFK